MSEYRQLHRSFWESQSVEQMDPVEKLLYCYLITSPASNMEGLYKISMRRIAFETGVDRDMVVQLCARLTEKKLAGYKDGWVCVTQATAHMPGNPLLMAHADDLYATAGDDILAWAFRIGYELPQGYEAWLKEGKPRPTRKARGIGAVKGKKILDRDGNRCTLCGSQDDLVIHHVLRVADGGTNSEDNLVTVCRSCHTGLHKDDPSPWSEDTLSKKIPYPTRLDNTKQDETPVDTVLADWKRRHPAPYGPVPQPVVNEEETP